MVHTQTVTRWSAQSGLTNSLRRWTWCSQNLPMLMQALASTGPVDHLPVVNRAALAHAFWSWAATLDAYADLEALDPVDCAHFQTGMLLAQLLQHRPLRLQGARRDEEVQLLTAAADARNGARARLSSAVCRARNPKSISRSIRWNSRT